jgi:hypothetical protein
LYSSNSRKARKKQYWGVKSGDLSRQLSGTHLGVYSFQNFGISGAFIFDLNIITVMKPRLEISEHVRIVCKEGEKLNNNAGRQREGTRPLWKPKATRKNTLTSEFNVNLSMSSSVHCTGLEFFIRFQPRYIARI